MSYRYVFLAVVVFFCVELTGEQAKNPEGKTNITVAKDIDVCTTLSTKEVARVAGEALTQAKKGKFPGGHPQVRVSQCTYSNSNGLKSVDVFIKYSTRKADSPEAVRKLLMDMGSKIEDVPGVADTAFWSGGQLHAFKGKNLLIQISLSGFKNPRQTAVAVAKAFLAKIS